MAETKYIQEQVDALKEADVSLQRSEELKYADYKSKDPFPKVGEALLNSADLLMYILTVGIVEPFHVENLKGVTYACSFSGEAHYYDAKQDKMVEKKLNDGEELELEQNSITYLKIEEKFHVPEYMVLRFNLSVSNAYKGVLLGTGPIVDPGFEGSLFIPLHNLTGNKYIIKKGAPLIRVEFTKLSSNSEWKAARALTKTVPADIKPITKNTPHDAKFNEFIEDALLDSKKKMFYTNGVSVRSSIPDAIKKSAEQAANAEKAVNRMTAIGAIGFAITLIGILVAVFALLIPTWQAFDSFNKERSEYRSAIIQYQETIEKLEQRLTTFEIDDKQEEIDLLQEKLNLLIEEYTSIDDENSFDAKNINEQIDHTKAQIAKLEKDIIDLQKQIG